MPPAAQEEVQKEKPCLLLGKEAWQFSQWRAETDDIRGGSSRASFLGLTDASGHAEFGGLLCEVDNAFAAMSLSASSLRTPLCELKGLLLELGEADGQDYAVALRMLGAPAGLEHMYQFKAEPGSTVEMYFRDFKPMLRGHVLSKGVRVYYTLFNKQVLGFKPLIFKHSR